MSKFSCQFCSKVYSSKNSLWAHRKLYHRKQWELSKTKKANCILCEFSALKSKDLLWHYNNNHDKNLKLMQQNFVSESDFNEWKKDLERKTNTLFGQTCGKERSQDYEVTRYYCHRSGNYVPSGTGARSLKAQGSLKMNGKCPAYMVKRKRLSSGRISVEYCSDHVGHSVELCHLKLSSEIRNMIRSKIENGMESKQILDSIRDRIGNIDRDAMVTRKDIINIRNQCDVTKIEKQTEEVKREDTEVLTCAFNGLKEKCGDITAELFMSDLDDNYYNAWQSVFKQPIQRLYCNWLVNKRWRKQISEFVPKTKTQVTLYAYLKTLHYETNEDKFDKMLREARSYLVKTSPQFHEYFLKNFVFEEKYRMWASCFRIAYFGKKGNRSTGKLLVTLIKMSRDKKSTRLLAAINKRHRLASTVREVTCLACDQWKVDDLDDQECTVKRIQPQCMDNCQIKCSICNICVHMYTCTCSDFLVHTVACKHIHAVKMSGAESEPLRGQTSVQQNCKKEFQGIVESTIVGTSKKTQSIKSKLIKDLESVIELVRTVDDEGCLNKMMHHTTAMLSIGKRRTQPLPIFPTLPPVNITPATKQSKDHSPFLSVQLNVTKKRINNLAIASNPTPKPTILPENRLQAHNNAECSKVLKRTHTSTPVRILSAKKHCTKPNLPMPVKVTRINKVAFKSTQMLADKQIPLEEYLQSHNIANSIKGLKRIQPSTPVQPIHILSAKKQCTIKKPSLPMQDVVCRNEINDFSITPTPVPKLATEQVSPDKGLEQSNADCIKGTNQTQTLPQLPSQKIPSAEKQGAIQKPFLSMQVKVSKKRINDFASKLSTKPSTDQGSSKKSLQAHNNGDCLVVIA
uniref:Sinc finger protein Ci-ZF(C2H2)-148 n=1 Tax=Ciona intestinalis TaxID=7719 RepID=Q1RL53_CIOIN|nr:sinc finger protein Ci-ZF(C2H2)-148 [Ciona intestinalis]FAA00212.1 TPA: zinc finger protein [Ciona intestinalis]|eukprot:NP_001121593.1 sinc finger protein Ci-ZF(C2H2)-148 [Ciona intestinalis]